MSVRSPAKRKFYELSCPDCNAVFLQRSDYRNKSQGRCPPCAIKWVGVTYNKTHGLNNKNSRLHVTWSNMKRRCINPVGKEKTIYKNITLCNEWHKFEPFMEWALANGYTETNTIDRIDNLKGYEPSNCRFVSYSAQSANRRKIIPSASGFLGVYESKGAWKVRVQWERKKFELGRYADPVYAAKIRDKFIVDNGLPHTLNFPTSAATTRKN